MKHWGATNYHSYHRHLSGIFGLLDLNNGKCHIVAKCLKLVLWPTRRTIPNMATIDCAVFVPEGRELREIVRLSDSDDDDDSITKRLSQGYSLNGWTDRLALFTTCATDACKVPFYKIDFLPPFWNRKWRHISGTAGPIGTKLAPNDSDGHLYKIPTMKPKIYIYLNRKWRHKHVKTG